MTDRALRACAPLVVACASVAYVLTAARTVIGGDDGELSTLLVTGGAAHPPGYPLYVMWLRALRWIPAASPAHAAALATSALAALAVAALLGACRAWRASEGASAIAVAAYAVAPLTWSLATQAEVFALNALFAALILWVAAPTRPIDGAPRVALLGLLAGLALANHHTIVELAPIGLYAAIDGVRRARSRVAAVALGLVALAAGLLPYAYVWLHARRSADPAIWTWGGVTDLPSLWRFFRRSQYADARLSSGGHVIALVWRVTKELDGLPLLAAAAAVLWTSRGGREAVTRVSLATVGPWIALGASITLAGPAFAAIFDVPIEGIGGAITERFYLLPMALVVVAGARALDYVIGPPLGRGAVALGATGVILAAGVTNALPRLRAEHRPFIAQYVQNTLEQTPPNAILLGSGDHRFGAFLYARWALRERRDVVFVSPRMLLAPWYHARVEAELGLPLVAPKDGSLDVVALVAQLVASGRPVFLTNPFLPGAIERRFPTYAIGTLIRVLPPGSAVPDPDALAKANDEVERRYAREIDPPPQADPWARDLADDYARPWRALAGAFARRGDEARAAACRARAEAWLAVVGEATADAP